MRTTLQLHRINHRKSFMLGKFKPYRNAWKYSNNWSAKLVKPLTWFHDVTMGKF